MEYPEDAGTALGVISYRAVWGTGAVDDRQGSRRPGLHRPARRRPAEAPTGVRGCSGQRSPSARRLGW